ncbi:MAG TPA: ATP-binding SpoIIE family protein phosphatase [Actinocrinis sp.]|nr:ATP-binding SpoIIE family protein phosphatase [Actinocrinis sp.]
MNLTLLESEDVAWFRDELTAARGAAAALARRVGLSPQRSGEVSLAVSELASNLAKHAQDGSILLRVVRTDHHAGVEVLSIDKGPGMVDVAESVRDGVSSAGTLGIGLGAVVRLADSVDVDSAPGRGTILAARFWAAGVRPNPAGQGPAGPNLPEPGRPSGLGGAGTQPSSSAERTGASAAAGQSPPDPTEPHVAGLTRAISGEQVCGDAWNARRSHDQGEPAVFVMLCDGLGHGPMAALAGEAAVNAFRIARLGSPAEVVEQLHRALRGTRGAALAVARIEAETGLVQLCGVGNIAAAVVGSESKSSLVSMPGIVGHQLPSLRTFSHELPRRGALVMHSDGLSDRWDASAVPGLAYRSPIVVAAQLLRHAGIRHDDASVVVAKGIR